MMIAVMVAMMAFPVSLSAQSLFCRQNNATTRYMLKYDDGVYGMLNNTNRATYTPSVTGAGNQPFGIEPEAPLGSGVLMLIAAGAGYAVLKSKKSK